MLGEMKADEDPKPETDEWRAPIKRPPRGEDLPYSDGEPVESDRHIKQMSLLIDVLREGWTARRDFYVAGNMALYFSEIQSKRNDFRAPDLFVVLGVDPKERKSWVVWEEDGATPDVVIEILSESTEQVDRGEKMRIYAAVLKVPFYALYDPFTHVFEGYALDVAAKRYRRIPARGNGRVPCEPLGLELGLWEGDHRGIHTRWLRLFEPSGALIELKAEQETRRANEVARRAEDEARRADEQTRRAEKETRRADEEMRRADEAAKRADDASKRLAELEAQLAEYQRKHGKPT
jgi:Uma2 family endonuclease